MANLNLFSGWKKSFSKFLGNMFDPYNTSNVVKDDEQFRQDIGGDPVQVKNFLKSGYLSFVEGIPYQFLSSVDTRVNYMGSTASVISTSNLGRKYTQKIVSRMPLLFLVPCRQKFMEGFSNQARDDVLVDLLSGGGGLNRDSNEVSTVGRYYSTEFAYDSFASMLEVMIGQMCYFMGIGEQEISYRGLSPKKVKNIDFCYNKDNSNNPFNNFWAASQALAFYVDGNSVSSVTDSFSNSTTESSLASTINGLSDQQRELKFLIGSGSAISQIYDSGSQITESILGGLSGLAVDMGAGMIGNLAQTGVNSVLHGGKIILPKIWEDSQYSKSYSFDIKLRSPDHDSLSIFLNIIVPYLKLLCLVLPQNTDELKYNPNAYSSPFLVRAYCKGMFNIDMGIITDMTVTRGAECQWNDNGLPTQIDISLTIEDLYSSLMSTSFDKYDHTNNILGGVRFLNDRLNPLARSLAVVSNTGMMDYLSNLAGLNIATEEIGRRERMLVYLTDSGANHIGSSISHMFDNFVANIVRRGYDRR